MNNNKATFDIILEEKIGFGKYQIIAILFLCLVDFNDGVELISMSLIMPIIKKEWEISNLWVEVISSVFYLGMLIGAILTGKIADNYGRRPTILYASLVQFFIGFSFSIINNVFLLAILRFLYGFCYGFSLPLTISVVSEITPIKYRGKCIVFTNFCVSIGKLYGIILASIIFKDLNSGNWRLLMFLCSLSSLIVVYGMTFYVKESCRFLMSIGKIDESIEILDHMGYMNKQIEYKGISENEREELICFQKNMFVAEEQANPKLLLSDKDFPITIRLWVIWFALIFVEFGQYVILPFILISQASGFGTLLLAIFGEIPAIIFSLYFIDMKNLGRKKTLYLCLGVLAVINIFAYILSKNLLGLILSLERFFMKNSFSMLIPLTSELYPTNYRTVGYGIATAVGRLAATLSPFVLLSLFNYDHYNGFIVFFLLCSIATFASYTIPFDTTGKYLDSFIVRERKIYLNDQI